MEIITLDQDNLATEHVCCAIANDNDIQVAAKKEWLAARFAQGLRFKKCAVRGKCFIEYIPAEQAWAPIDAPGYMYIDCLWVAGQFKGQGYGRQLLEECLADSRAQGKRGLLALSAKKKQAFLADPKFLSYFGFQPVDEAAPFYQLFCLPLEEKALVQAPPRFRPQARRPHIEAKGLVLYYSHQCPFTAKYVPIVAQLARERGVELRTVLFETTDQAQAAPAPFTSYSLFYNGELITHEILSDKKFVKLLDQLGL